MTDFLRKENVRLRKISVNLGGHATSFSLEGPFLERLQGLAAAQNISFAAFIRKIDSARPDDMNLSSALRLVAFYSLSHTNEPSDCCFFETSL